MMRFLLWLFLLIPATLFAQSSPSISGYVRDARTGEALIGATAYLPALKTGTQANNYGYFSLSLLPADSATVVFSFIGYTPQTVRLRATQNQTLTIQLTAEGRTLDEVAVRASANDDNVQRPQMSTINVPMKQIRTLPMIAGERDILKVIQFLPGVQSGSEGTTGFFVRGGNIDQNLVLLDEATVYNPNHLFGLFSTFNVNALNSVNLIKGGFPAQYGGRLSSVLDITMKEGNRNKFSGEGGIGLISSNLTLEGPLQRGKSSFIVSARRSYLDLLIKAASPTNANNTNYYLYDLNAKMNYELGKKDHLFVSAFKGQDKAAFTGASSLNYGINFGNSSATVRWNHLFGQKLFLNTSLIYSDYHLSLSTTQNNYYALLYTGISDWTAKTTLEWYPNANHSIKVGGQFTDHTFSPATTSAKIPKKGIKQQLVPDSIKHIYGTEVALFANDEIRLTDQLAASVGVRVPVYASRGATYTRLEPRLTLKYAFTPVLSVKAAYTEMNQFLHLVPNSTASLPTDIWISSSPRVQPQRSRQVALGLFRNIGSTYELSVEAYYKTMQSQVLFREGTQIVLDTDLDSKLAFGKGESYGIEWFVRKNTGRLTGWLAYTLSKTTQTFADLNYGQPFPFAYDKRHVLSVVSTYELTPRWTLSANFVFNSGGAYTLPAGRVSVAGDGTLYDGTYYDFTSRNNARFRAYNRLDINAIYHKTRHLFHKAYESEWVFGAYNVYSRLNPYFVYLTTDPATKRPEARQVSLLPIIPSVSYNFKF